MNSFIDFYNIDNFMPHGHCFYWIPELLWTLVISDSVIVLSYYAIPFMIIYSIRNRLKNSRKEVKIILVMFSVFILACGTTHLIGIINIWHPDYYLSAIAKSITAIVSFLTAVLLIPTVKKADSYILQKEETNITLNSKNIELEHVVKEFIKQKDELSILNKMSDYLQACNTEEEILETLINSVSKLWPDSSGAVYLLHEDNYEYRKSNNWGSDEFTETIMHDECWSNRLNKCFPDTASSDSVICKKAGCGLVNIHYCFPIISGGHSLALLHITKIDFYNDTHSQDIISIICNRLGLAIYNLKLKNHLEFQSTRDPLTSLSNRQYMEQSLLTEINRSSRNGNALTVAFLDIDYFKVINDEYGHNQGDDVLKEFGELMKNTFRSGDILCRYGGEEFLVILPETNMNVAETILDRMSKIIKEDSKSKLSKITFSAGLAQYPMHGTEPHALIKQADTALYRAKANGRNRIEKAAI